MFSTKRKEKEAKNVGPKRGSLITSYFQTIEKTDSENRIDNMIRITELENKVRKLENEKDQLRRQIANLTKKNAERIQDRENLHQKCAKSTKPKQATVNTDMQERNSSKVKKDSASKVKATEIDKRTEHKQEKENEKVKDIQGKEGFRNNSSGRGKSLIVAASHSVVKDLHGWMMSRANTVKVHSSSGATTTDMTHHLKPLFRKKPDRNILHAGNNDLCETWMTPQDIANNIFNLIKTINSEGIKCSVWGRIRRDDELSEKGQ